ncbi:hypothetical protein QTP88_027336 [Uroleucon formosanum]
MLSVLIFPIGRSDVGFSGFENRIGKLTRGVGLGCAIGLLDSLSEFGECVKEWSQALGLQLTVNSMVCDRHFNPEDMLYKELLIGGSKKILKVLIYPALPISINTTQSVSYASKYVPGM